HLDLPRATASSSFFIFRCDRTQVEPGYLAWFLNAPLTQHKLKQNLTGTYTLNLNRSVLEQLEIVLPSLEQQRKIASLDQLMQTEKNLSRELMRKREHFVQTLLSNSLNPDQ
ncbi:MAG: restriction endonuclease subunit S, partial [Schleiferiaceae bacterium]|nr:restriction endonuclease subunit S [Schleiferiaceae bacterium]